MKHLSRFDIEAIADKYVQAYMALPDVRNTQIYRIDPELLLEKVLGLNVEYQHLSYDGSILGMTSFTEMGVQVFERSILNGKGKAGTARPSLRSDCRWIYRFYLHQPFWSAATSGNPEQSNPPHYP